MRVRDAAEADMDLVVDQTWAVAEEGRWIGTEVPFDRSARRAVLEALASPDAAGGCLLVLEDDDAGVVGHISVRVAPYGVADIGMLLIDGWRGRGGGRLLLDAAIERAVGLGAHKMALQAWPHNEAALALYRRAGFVEEGRLVRHYRRRSGELWDAVIMGRLLGGAQEETDRN